MCVCVCVCARACVRACLCPCVCEWVRERQRDRGRQTDRPYVQLRFSVFPATLVCFELNRHTQKAAALPFRGIFTCQARTPVTNLGWVQECVQLAHEYYTTPANHRLTVFIFPNEHASGRTKDGPVTDEPRDKGSKTPKQHTLEEEKGKKKKEKKSSTSSSSSNVALRPQRLYELLGTWGPGRPLRLQFHTQLLGSD